MILVLASKGKRGKGLCNQITRGPKGGWGNRGKKKRGGWGQVAKRVGEGGGGMISNQNCRRKGKLEKAKTLMYKGAGQTSKIL